MNFFPARIPEVVLIEPRLFSDERGYFMETWERKKFSEAGIDFDFVQDNHSHSVKGALRGLHYQIRQPQGKLIRVTAGEVFDAVVDIRRNSATFGQWVGELLSAENKRMLWVPRGFAHGFLVTSSVADVHYKCTDYYAPEHERSIRWNDEEVGIAWPISPDEAPLVSEKDRLAPFLHEAELYD